MGKDDNYQLRQVQHKDEMLALADRIKDNFPFCVQMYNTLLINARGYSEGFQYEIYVPKDYSDSHIIIWRTVFQRRGMGIYCQKDEIPLLTKVIQSSDYLSLISGSPIYIKFLSYYQVDPLLETLQEKLQETLQKAPDFLFAYVNHQNNMLRCPAGMKVQRLGRAGVQRMLESNKYWKKTSLDLACNLTKNLPALGIYLDPNITEENAVDFNELNMAEDDAIPISWVSTNPYGSIGLLMTEEKYRKLGLASLLVQLMGRLHVADGYFPYSVVEDGNKVSAAVFKKLTGWTESHQVYYIKPPHETLI